MKLEFMYTESAYMLMREGKGEGEGVAESPVRRAESLRDFARIVHKKCLSQLLILFSEHIGFGKYINRLA